MCSGGVIIKQIVKWQNLQEEIVKYMIIYVNKNQYNVEILSMSSS